VLAERLREMRSSGHDLAGQVGRGNADDPFL
jgi:hypothetical protein